MEIIERSNNEIYKKQNKNNQNKNKIILIILGILISFSLGVLVMYFFSNVNRSIIQTKYKDRVISETKVTEEAMEDAIDLIYDAVICIEVMDQNGNLTGTGTGFVYDKDDKYGYVLTNAHVVSNAKSVTAKLSNEKVVDLTILGTDVYTDLAVLRMDVKEVLSVASIGKSENTKVGNTVFTVGSPMGVTYMGTVTKGILSGKNRLVETQATSGLTTDSYIVKVLQTDAAISPGNSGGPLVNLAGDVIGITSLKLVNEQVEGMGFAIPIEDAMKYVDHLEKGEKIERPLLGVQILDLTNQYVLYRYGITVPSDVKQGIYLVDVSSGSSADNAGLKKGDIITEMDGVKIKTAGEFKYELYKHSIGEEVEIKYYRNGKKSSLKIKLDKSN